MNIELVDKPADLALIDEARETTRREIFALRGELFERLNAFLNRYNAETKGLKDLRAAIADLGKSQAEHGRQILGLLKYLGLDPFKTADLLPQPPESNELQPSESPRAPLPIPDWQARCKAEAEKLEKELPELSTIDQLRERFGVSRKKIENLIRSRKLPIVQLDKLRTISRESVIAYVKAYGVLKPKPRPPGARQPRGIQLDSPR
jgi:hypothetical protein